MRTATDRRAAKLVGLGRELGLEVVDLANQVVDPLGDVAAKLIGLAQLRLEVGDALVPLPELAREPHVLIAELATPIDERTHGPLEAIEVVALVGSLRRLGNLASPDRSADPTDRRRNASSGFCVPKGEHQTNASRDWSLDSPTR